MNATMQNSLRLFDLLRKIQRLEQRQRFTLSRDHAWSVMWAMLRDAEEAVDLAIRSLAIGDRYWAEEAHERVECSLAILIQSHRRDQRLSALRRRRDALCRETDRLAAQAN